MLRSVQLFLALNLVGPIILFFCFIVRSILGLHVIFFRNPRTKHQFYGAVNIAKDFLKSYAMGGAAVVGGMVVVHDYRNGGLDSMIKKTIDYHIEGVVRLTTDQEKEFTFLKDKKLKLPLSEMREYDSRNFDKKKLEKALSLPKYSVELNKLSPKDLNELDMVALIPEAEVVRFNIINYERVCAQKGTISDYIYSFSGEEKEDVLAGTKTPPTKIQFHKEIGQFIRTARSTSTGRKNYDDFLSGKSTTLLDSWKYGKSSWD